MEGAPPDALLMDWRGPAPPAGEPPSFLYALPLPDGRWFADETVLVSRPEIPIGALRARLHRRLDRMQIRMRARHEVERCGIPMGMPLPTGSMAAFGSAAGFIHPATGYSLAMSLRLAGRLGDRGSPRHRCTRRGSNGRASRRVLARGARARLGAVPLRDGGVPAHGPRHSARVLRRILQTPPPLCGAAFWPASCPRRASPGRCSPTSGASAGRCAGNSRRPRSDPKGCDSWAIC